MKVSQEQERVEVQQPLRSFITHSMIQIVIYQNKKVKVCFLLFNNSFGTNM